MLDSPLIDRGPLHANQEVVLVVNQEYKDILAQSVVLRRHIVLRVGQNSGLEDGSKVGRGHFVNIRFGSKDSEQVEDVEKQLAVERRQLLDTVLIDADS